MSDHECCFLGVGVVVAVLGVKVHFAHTLKVKTPQSIMAVTIRTSHIEKDLWFLC